LDDSRVNKLVKFFLCAQINVNYHVLQILIYF
jgi:hypothetical protein